MDKNRTNIEGGVVFMDKLIIKIDENYMYKVYDTLKEFSVYIFYSFFHYQNIITFPSILFENQQEQNNYQRYLLNILTDKYIRTLLKTQNICYISFHHFNVLPIKIEVTLGSSNQMPVTSDMMTFTDKGISLQNYTFKFDGYRVGHHLYTYALH